MDQLNVMTAEDIQKYAKNGDTELDTHLFLRVPSIGARKNTKNNLKERFKTSPKATVNSYEHEQMLTPDDTRRLTAGRKSSCKNGNKQRVRRLKLVLCDG